MTFAVQDDTGGVSGANAYVSVADFKTYHDDRGNDYSGAVDDAALEVAIIKATDYLDTRFRYMGKKRLGRDQLTEWPRTSAWDRDRYYLNDVPVEVKEATSEYALRAIAGSINPDPVLDDTGRIVQSKSEKVGPIEESKKYVEGGGFSLPAYPEADQKLKRAGFVLTSGQILRA